MTKRTPWTTNTILRIALAMMLNTALAIACAQPSSTATPTLTAIPTATETSAPKETASVPTATSQPMASSTPVPTETPTLPPTPADTPTPIATETPVAAELPVWAPTVSNTEARLSADGQTVEYYGVDGQYIVSCRQEGGGHRFYNYAERIVSLVGGKGLGEVYPELFVREGGEKILLADPARIRMIRVKRYDACGGCPGGIEMFFDYSKGPVLIYYPFTIKDQAGRTIDKGLMYLYANPDKNLPLTLKIVDERGNIRVIRDSENRTGDAVWAGLRTPLLELGSDGVRLLGRKEYDDDLNLMLLDSFAGSGGRLRY